MKPEYNINDEAGKQENLHEASSVYQTQEPLVEGTIRAAGGMSKSSHQQWLNRKKRLDEQYLEKYATQTFEEALANALTPEEFMAEMGKRIRQW